MISSGFKLIFATMAMLGPFGAGAMRAYVVHAEIYVFFLLGGVLLGLVGLFGFASIERDELAAHRRHLQGER
ncbi:hypothetical protein [Bosea sp. (in: a-proteobacteria)]|uniref:hypothetical protein n=1 Tax=Bosea sp. (in: a-proteobacteria) TaxID=1871050 RepID=UPI0027336B79|nr:hypothetical protein [Bosea sp. (in: a-proteobacteria)]MDP3408226.1 hypothetical protein [Bosea sp. (in: a-proteobacteria)]